MSGRSRRGALPHETIVDAAARENADLIVMGTRGRRGAARLLLGSVAARVIAMAPCPVLTLRSQTAAAAARGVAESRGQARARRRRGPLMPLHQK